MRCRGFALAMLSAQDVKLLEQMRSGMQPWNVSLPAQAAARAAASEVAFAKKTAQQVAKNRQWMIGKPARKQV